MKLIELNVYGIVIKLDPGHVCEITSDLKESCPHCGNWECNFSCDQSQMSGSDESEDDVVSRLASNWAFCGVEALILAQACAGIDVESPAYLEGIETAVQAIGNNL